MLPNPNSPADSESSGKEMIRKKIKYLTVLFVISLTIVSCKNSTNSPVSSGDLIPLKTDNMWIYRTTTADTLGNVRSTKVDTTKLAPSVTIQGINWYFFLGPGSTSPANATFLANQSDGVWGLDQQRQRSFLLFQYPTIGGMEYTVWTDSIKFGTDSAIIQFNIKVISTSENIVGVKQSFSCCHYQPVSHLINLRTGEVESQSVSDVYVASGIGIVKSVDRSSGNIITVLLQDYVLQ